MMPTSNNHAYWFIADDGRQRGEIGINITPEIIEWAKAKRYGLYYSVNPVGTIRNANGNLREEPNMLFPVACFVDFDDGTAEEQWKLLHKVPYEPSKIIQSGRGLHAYWYLESTAKTDFPEWTRIQKALARYCKGDTKCSDPARLMRLPNSWYTKDGNPRLVTIIKENDVKFSLKDFSSLFPLRQTVYTLPPRTIKRSEVKPIPIRTLHKNERHGSLISQAARMYGMYSSDAWPELRAELRTWYAASCVELKDIWEEELMSVFQWFERKEYGK